MRTVCAVLLLALGACHEEPTIVIKFEPNDLAAAAARRDGGSAAKATPADGGVKAAVDGGAKAASPAPKDDPKQTACKSDADCVAIPADCCGCSAGGTQVAVAKADKAKTMAARAKSCGATTACITMLSTDPSCAKKAACEKARCVLK